MQLREAFTLTLKDLSNIDLGDETFLPIVDNFNYLGSTLSRDCSDEEEVNKRITKASNAFGSLRKPIFANGCITIETKKRVYEGLILPILLYGSETWSLKEKLYSKLHVFHHQCVRVMNRVNRRETWEQKISMQELLDRLGVKMIDIAMGWSCLLYAFRSYP